MTNQQYSALAWWYENGQEDVVLHVIDTDSGQTEVIEIKDGISSVGRVFPCDHPIRGVIMQHFPDLNNLDDAAFAAIKERNLSAVADNADMPDAALISDLDEALGAWLSETISFLHTYGDIRVLLIGSAADFFPLEAALRVQYDITDVFLDNPYLLTQAQYSTPRRCLTDRGRAYIRQGHVTLPFAKDLSILLIDEQGDEQTVCIAHRGDKNAVDPIECWVTSGSKFTFLWGGERLIQSISLTDNVLTKVTVTAESADPARILFHNANGELIVTTSLH